MSRTERKSRLMLKAAESALREELSGITRQLTIAYADFNNSVEPELIEASVYNINALQAKYAYLLKSIKTLGCADIKPFSFPKSEKSAVLGEVDVK